MTRYRQRELNQYMKDNQEMSDENKALVKEFGDNGEKTPREIIQHQVKVIGVYVDEQKQDRQLIGVLRTKVEDLEAKCINLESTLTEVRKATKEEVPQFGPA